MRPGGKQWEVDEAVQSKKTPLFDRHVALGGRMVDFGGWALPIQYVGILKEHEQVRTGCGLFDVSHMGEIWVRGPEACAWLDTLLTNDMQSLVPGQVRYSPMCASDGGTVDDVLVYCFSKDEYLLVVNAANDDKDYAHMRALRPEGVALEHASRRTGQLALQGPKAAELLARHTDAPLSEIGYYAFLPRVKVAGIPVLLSRTGYTGEDGFELYAAWEDTGTLWDALLADAAIQPIGLGARDTLRFESRLPLYGHELSPEISPLMAGLSAFVKLGKPFMGRNALAAQKAGKRMPKLAAFELVGRGVPRAGMTVLDASGRAIGHVTSGGMAPTLGKPIGLALVPPEYAAAGTELALEIRGKAVPARVAKDLFYRRPGAKSAAKS